MLNTSLESIIAARAREEKERKRSLQGAKAQKGRGRRGRSRSPQKQEGGPQRPTDLRRQARRGRRGGPFDGEPRHKRERRLDPDSEEVWGHEGFHELQDPKPTSARATRAPSSTSGGESRKPPLATGTRIMVTNLDPAVDKEEVLAMFSTCGEVLSAMIHRNEDGTSRGLAEVVYHRRSDAAKAVEEFDCREVDQKFIRVNMMGATVVTREDEAPDAGTDRFAPPSHIAAKPARGRGAQEQRNAVPPARNTDRGDTKTDPDDETARAALTKGLLKASTGRGFEGASRGDQPGRGRGRGRGGGRGRRGRGQPDSSQAPFETKESLDAALDAYVEERRNK